MSNVMLGTQKLEEVFRSTGWAEGRGRGTLGITRVNGNHRGNILSINGTGFLDYLEEIQK
jgi:hypothetical protein